MIILKAKELSQNPISVITNGALLYNSEVAKALMLADVILPSLDAGDSKLFIKINRPHPSLKYNDIIQALIEAKTIRPNRYTILNKVKLNKERAKNLAKKCGII